jgi:hypothetical protein
MATVLSPGNPGPIYDPRLKAQQNWLDAVQSDLKSMERELSNIPGRSPIGTPSPVSSSIFNPTAHPHGFMPGRRYGHTAAFGPLTRIG